MGVRETPYQVRQQALLLRVAERLGVELVDERLMFDRGHAFPAKEPARTLAMRDHVLRSWSRARWPDFEHSAHVYFVLAKDHRLVKVGVATNLRKRLDGLRSMSPVPLQFLLSVHRGGRALERCLHDRFAQYRHHGEWFRCEGEVLRFIEVMQTLEVA